jgi:hypothetical protein
MTATDLRYSIRRLRSAMRAASLGWRDTKQEVFVVSAVYLRQEADRLKDILNATEKIKATYTNQNTET